MKRRRPAPDRTAEAWAAEECTKPLRQPNPQERGPASAGPFFWCDDVVILSAAKNLSAAPPLPVFPAPLMPKGARSCTPVIHRNLPLGEGRAGALRPLLFHSATHFS